MLKIEYQKKFLKDLADIPSVHRREIEDFVFDYLPNCKTLADSGKFEKMSGYDNCYKARIGNYRVGIIFENGTITLKRVLHRKEIYRFFP